MHGVDQEQRKPSVMQAVQEFGTVIPVHLKKHKAAHENTDYERWYGTKSSYEIKYSGVFEPYMAGPLHNMPRYDERFAGYGMDKVAHSLANSSG